MCLVHGVGGGEPETAGVESGWYVLTACCITCLPRFKYQTQASLTITAAPIQCCLSVGSHRKAVLPSKSEPHIRGSLSECRSVCWSEYLAIPHRQFTGEPESLPGSPDSQLHVLFRVPCHLLFLGLGSWLSPPSPASSSVLQNSRVSRR